MRDRREALKLLAGGTAAAVATSVITTSHAFADGGTTSCQPTGIPASFSSAFTSQSIQSGANDYPRLSITTSTGPLNAIACPSGQLSFQYRWSLPSRPTSGIGTPARIVTNSSLTDITGVWQSENDVRVVDDAVTNRLSTTGSYRVALDLRAICRPTGRVCWLCANATYQFTWTYNGAPASTITNVVVATDTGSTECDSSPPT